jgi:hypothetical protein
MLNSRNARIALVFRARLFLARLAHQTRHYPAERREHKAPRDISALPMVKTAP